jgi:hypothetical protein
MVPDSRSTSTGWIVCDLGDKVPEQNIRTTTTTTAGTRGTSTPLDLSLTNVHLFRRRVAGDGTPIPRGSGPLLPARESGPRSPAEQGTPSRSSPSQSPRSFRHQYRLESADWQEMKSSDPSSPDWKALFRGSKIEHRSVSQFAAAALTCACPHPAAGSSQLPGSGTSFPENGTTTDPESKAASRNMLLFHRLLISTPFLLRPDFCSFIFYHSM